AERLELLSRRHEQAISLIDARYFAAQAYWRLGAYTQANLVTRAYFADAREKGSYKKEQIARNLMAAIQQCDITFGNSPTAVEPILLVFRKSSGFLLVNNSEVDLRRQPTLSKMIEILITRGA